MEHVYSLGFNLLKKLDIFLKFGIRLLVDLCTTRRLNDTFG